MNILVRTNTQSNTDLVPIKCTGIFVPAIGVLKDNTSLTEEEVKAGVCGGQVIPFGDKTVPKGSYIYEFSTPEGTRAHADHFDSEGNYRPAYPGFTKDGTHPDNLCIPCCFKNWNAPSQVKRREVCDMSNFGMDETSSEALGETSGEVSGKPEEGTDGGPPKPPPLKRMASEGDDYVKAPTKFPLDQNRWGFLPMPIQVFFNINNKDCLVSGSSRHIKPNIPCILRKGVENDKKQSFIGCLADLYVEYEDTEMKLIPTIAEMKQILVDSLQVSKFITYQNGSLVTTFTDRSMEVDTDKYASSPIFKNIKRENLDAYYHKIVSAFENFKKYLLDPDSDLDYTYLWDIVSAPNPKLFPKGLNLVVLNIPDDDLTNNVEFVCPTNHYSSTMYDSRKGTFILIKQYEYFEPIYSYTDMGKTIVAKKLFYEKQSTTNNNIKKMLFAIKNTVLKSCAPLKSLPNEYKFKENINLDRLVGILGEIGYKLDRQVVNFSGKVIGMSVENESGDSGFIPCYPSVLADEIDFTYIDDDSLWKNYADTVNFLNTTHELSRGKIPCKPVIKTIEDALVVGVLTETNQFVQLEQPEENISKDDLIEQDDLNYVQAETDILNAYSEKGIDEERIRYVKRIKLETNFYNVFRNTIRILLNNPEFVSLRQDIESLVESPYTMYYDKLLGVNKILREMAKDQIDFVEYSDDMISKVENVTSCFKNTEEQCGSKPFCITSADMSCKLVIPINNLITEKNNENVYFTRMADEIIRYGRIRLFLFKPQAYLSFDKLGYNLHEDEIILLNTLLTQDYFENMVPETKSKYLMHESYGSVQPRKSVPYSNRKSFKELHEYIENIKVKKTDDKKKKKKIPKLKVVSKLKTAEDQKTAENETTAEDEKTDAAIPSEREDTPTEILDSPTQELTKTQTLTKTMTQSQIAPQETPSAVPEEVQKQLCEQTTRQEVRSSLRDFFAKGVRENVFTNETRCTYQVYLFILRTFYKDTAALTSYNADMAELKRVLWRQYQNFISDYEEVIYRILYDQGKQSMVLRLRNKEIGFEDLVMSEEYFLTALDYVLLNIYYKLPIVMISLKEYRMNNSKNIFMLNTSEKGKLLLY